MPPSQNQTRTSIARVSHAGERRSSLAWIGSLALHGAIVAGAMFTWTHRLDIADQSPPVVPVELVTIGEKTNIKAQVKEQPKIQPDDKIATVAPDNPSAPDIPPPPIDEAAPSPSQTAPSEPEIQKKPKPATPKVRPKEKPKAEAKKKEFNVNNVLALLNKVAPKPHNANTKKGERTIKGIGDQNAMTMDLVDALRNEISQCWNAPVAAPNPENLVVTLRVFLNPDGSVAQPPQLKGNSVSGDPFMRAAAEAARRAIYVCAPFKLPADRYSVWRDITVTFDPRQMAGQ